MRYSPNPPRGLLLVYLSIFSFFFQCRQETAEVKLENELTYARLLQFEEDETQVRVKSGNETLIFSKSELPLKKIMVIPTSAIAFLDALDQTDLITGISEPEYVFNSKVIDGYNKKKIEKIGSYNELYTEVIMVHQPDLLISTSNPLLSKFHEQLRKQGVKIIYLDDYLEEIPLAKAEYIKLFGLLTGTQKQADELFSEIEANYKSLSEKAKATTHKPSLLANGMYGDIWYMPGGNSFQAEFFRDAGADYLWSDNNETGTLNLSLEQVYEKGKSAGFWINAGDFASLEVLSAGNEKYRWFDAFQNKKVYNWGKRKSSSGANDYFESGVVRPDWILKDLVAILHPDLVPDHTLFYYQHLE